jgi:hypothetical protein
MGDLAPGRGRQRRRRDDGVVWVVLGAVALCAVGGALLVVLSRPEPRARFVDVVLAGLALVGWAAGLAVVVAVLFLAVRWLLLRTSPRTAPKAVRR